jgi:hypothetical protein
MGLFGKRRDKIIDLSESYNFQKRHPVKIQAKTQEISKEDSPPAAETSNSGGFFGGFFGGGSSTQSNSSSNTSENYERTESSESPLDAEEKRRRLAKRLATMTEKIEEISNQIYHLQQRLEVVEKKLNVNNY